MQGHVARRHSDIQSMSLQRMPSEIEKELERIKERLRITENDLMLERNSRLNSNSAQNVAVAAASNANNSDTSKLLKQMEEMKNKELKRQKEELKQNRENSKKVIQELNDKLLKFELTIKGKVKTQSLCKIWLKRKKESYFWARMFKCFS